jgi:endonuclease/exonuclease/phosphatase family metal-dependent hydrolase
MEIHPPAIDWVLASNQFSILEASIDRHHMKNLFPSDHYPVTATLDWMAPS